MMLATLSRKGRGKKEEGRRKKEVITLREILFSKLPEQLVAAGDLDLAG